jgi:hypothetical protein
MAGATIEGLKFTKNLSVNNVLPVITIQIHGTLFYLRTSSKPENRKGCA